MGVAQGLSLQPHGVEQGQGAAARGVFQPLPFYMVRDDPKP